MSGLVKQYVKTWRAFLRNRISIRFSVFVKWSCPSTSSLISLCSISLFNHERSALCNFFPNQTRHSKYYLSVTEHHHDVADSCGPCMPGLNPWVQFRKLTKSCKKREVHFSTDVHARGTSWFVLLLYYIMIHPSTKMCR